MRAASASGSPAPFVSSAVEGRVSHWPLCLDFARHERGIVADVIQAIAFYLFAAVVIVSAGMTISSRNPVHSVMWLILAFFNAAGLMVLCGAEFIAMLLVDRKSTRLNSSHSGESRMPSSA